MNQGFVNLGLTIIILLLAIITLSIDVKSRSYTVKSLRYPLVKSSDSDVCGSIYKMFNTSPSDFMLFVNALESAKNAYAEKAREQTCMLCKDMNNALPECRNEDVARWVFANCP